MNSRPTKCDGIADVTPRMWWAPVKLKKISRAAPKGEHDHLNLETFKWPNEGKDLVPPGDGTMSGFGKSSNTTLVCRTRSAGKLGDGVAGRGQVRGMTGADGDHFMRSPASPDAAMTPNDDTLF